MKRIERRACSRFTVPGASVAFSRRRWFGKRSVESDCALLDLSRGGARFLASERLSTGAQVDLEIELCDEPQPLLLSGRVRWSWLHPSGRFEVGVQFEPYGEQPGANAPVELHRIAVLEALHCAVENGWDDRSVRTARPAPVLPSGGPAGPQARVLAFAPQSSDAFARAR